MEKYLKNNLQYFKQFWAISKLFWCSNKKWLAISLAFMLLVLLQATTQLSVMSNIQQGNFLSALAAKDPQRFWTSIGLFLGLQITSVLLWSGYTYIRFKLILYWRYWLTNHFISQYLSNRAFYEISQLHKDIDNPDQRITEDIQGFTEVTFSIFLDVFNTVIQVIAFSGILWAISPNLMIFLLIYSGTATLIATGFFGRKLVNINFNQQKKEGNFRFGLIRLRENAESIAFYRGESQETNVLRSLFEQVYKNLDYWIRWQHLYFGSFIRFYEVIPVILPAIFIAPRVLSGELEIGKIAEAQGAFLALFRAMYLIVRRFENLTSLGAGIERLSEFYNILQQPRTDIKRETVSYPIIKTIENNSIAIQGLTLYTPNYQRTLCQSISIELQAGQGLLVQGTSGCGKSSLLRAIAGLWNCGSGTIIRPKLEEILFLPQRPYMVLGTLRQQLVYPQTHANPTDSELHQILQQINLPYLAERFGGFDTEKDWPHVLSLGEQQRVAFARILLAKPKYVILDEATSALDVKNEESFYQHLLETGATFISVGHRPSLLKYHQTILELLDSKEWKIQQI
uniref:ABC transporter ATP-binding protein n=1 Tax=Tolypothrix bouteillei VB521301 TaxID=1479485 RepID=A0A0C1NCL5_9CYAN